MIMIAENFSNEFDVLLDSYRRIKSFDDKEMLDSIEFNEYEKSVFLSQAQKEIIVELYSGRNNKGISFESSEESRRLLHKLTRQKTFDLNNVKSAEITKPDDLWVITYESCILQDTELPNNSEAVVKPVTQDTLFEVLRNPFKNPNKNRVLRTDRNNSIQLISKYNIKQYILDYIKRPLPIIVTDLGDLDIEGYSKPQEFELDLSLKDEILQRAVELAIRSKAIQSNNN